MSGGRRLVVGLEIHVRLSTRTKLFCPCPNDAGGAPNSRVCPVCLGLPGALPVLNREAVRLGAAAALALGARVAPRSGFDRKHYVYPDLPKGYQITQYLAPLATGGAVAGVPLRRAHLEEDAGTSRHGDAATLVDLNRAGAPLLEIVTEPAIGSAEQAEEVARAVAETLRFAGVTDAAMARGDLRVEPNVNFVGPDGATGIVEVKNLNSFASLVAAIRHEAARQATEAAGGGRETRGFDEERGVTLRMRSKEAEADYRYLPEPDLPPVLVAPEELAAWRAALPEGPRERRGRWIDEHGLSPADAAVLSADPALADYFDAAVSAAGSEHGRAVADFVRVDVLAGRAPDGSFPAPPGAAGSLVRLVREGRLARAAARERVWPEVVRTGRDPAEIAGDGALAPVADEAELRRLAREAVRAHPEAARAVRAGKAAAIGPIVGAVLRATGGRADASRVREIVGILVAGGAR